MYLIVFLIFTYKSNIKLLRKLNFVCIVCPKIIKVRIPPSAFVALGILTFALAFSCLSYNAPKCHDGREKAEQLFGLVWHFVAWSGNALIRF